MAEYIEREALVSDLEFLARHQDGFRQSVILGVIHTIKCVPVVDVAPVRHGRWEAIMEGVWNLPTHVCVGWRCSECGREEQHKEPYCNCGARMDGE